MARIFSEKFEGAGYENVGWNESEGVGSTVDEDAASFDCGSPTGWESQCLKIINGASDAYTYYSVGAEAIVHWRTELYMTAESFANNEDGMIAFSYDAGLTGFVWILYWGQDGSGNYTLRLNSKHDGNDHSYTAFLTPALNTKYRFEIKWDATNDKWSWKIDGTVQPNDQDASSPVTTEGNLTATHSTDAGVFVAGGFAGDAAWTCYYDLVACNDATWVGSEFTPQIIIF